jgi:hypothetical protein
MREKPKDPRTLMSFFEFVDIHLGHLQLGQHQIRPAAQRDAEFDLWQYKCQCGRMWAGEKLDLGIEMEAH